MPAARRWYHRPGQGPRQQLGFVAGHLHPFLIAWLFPPHDWILAAVLYAAVVVGAVTVLAIPGRLAAPAVLTVTAAIIAVTAAAFSTVPGLEWFPALYCVKLLAAHLASDEPS